MSPMPVDERTLVGWLGAATSTRASRHIAQGRAPLIRYGDVEEHVLDPASGTILRCDMTLRSETRPLLSAEMKRPEVATVDSPVLTRDAHEKAQRRGAYLYATCNFTEVALWDTSDGPQPLHPVKRMDLAAGMSQSDQALRQRTEIEQNWDAFLDFVEDELRRRDVATATIPSATLPPQVQDLKAAIESVAVEVSRLITETIPDNPALSESIRESFNHQFGVEMYLNLSPNRRQDLLDETKQVAKISCFVVAVRLLMYQALSVAQPGDAAEVSLDPLAITIATTDPQRIGQEIFGLLEHARRRTGDFELALTPTALDGFAFIEGHSPEIGLLWNSLLDVIRRSDWTGPATYVPSLYESLLDEEHRHLLGVHYTPSTLAEIIVAYTVLDPADVVLDPACGGGTFLTLAYERKKSLGSTHDQSLAECYGVEIADFAAAVTSLSLSLANPSAISAYPRVVKSDFFDTAPDGITHLVLPDVGQLSMPSSVDAIVGNPPYVRFEARTSEERQAVHAVLSRQWNRQVVAFPDFTGKADLWAFFVAHSHAWLKPGGRMAFVLSWSLLCTDYGEAVCRFLARYYRIDALIDSRVERFFAAATNTVVLLATKADPPDDVRSPLPNASIDPEHQVRFVRLKQPLDQLIDATVPRGKRAEDLMADILAVNSDVDELRWAIQVIPQAALWEIAPASETWTEEDENAEG